MSDTTALQMDPQILPKLYSLARLLKGQILRLFREPYNPDLLPVWPPPTEAKVRHKLTPSQRRAVAQRELQALSAPDPPFEYYEWLRVPPTRKLLLDAWRKEKARRKPNMAETNAAASRILRHMFTLYYGSEIGENIARHTISESRDELEQSYMAELLGASFIKVRANPRWSLKKIKPGTEMEIEACEFLKAVHQYALAHDQSGGPPFEPVGQNSTGWKAHNCLRILEYLGQQRRQTPKGEAWESVRIVTVLRGLGIPAQGNRYQSICGLLDGLSKLRIVSLRKGRNGRTVRLYSPRVKRIHSPTDGKTDQKMADQ